MLGKLTSLGVEFTEALWVYLNYQIWQPCLTDEGWNLIVNCITWWVLMHLHHAFSTHHIVVLVELCNVMAAPAPPRQNGGMCTVVAVGGGIWCFNVLAITPLLLGGPISHEGAWVMDEDSYSNKLLMFFPGFQLLFVCQSFIIQFMKVDVNWKVIQWWCLCRRLLYKMEFCPTCGNMLQYELPYMGRPSRFYCPTCPYVCYIENRVGQISFPSSLC